MTPQRETHGFPPRPPFLHTSYVDQPTQPARWVNSPHVSVAATFEIPYTQYLDEQGRPTQPLPELASDTAHVVDLYRWMALMRAYDTKAIALQRTGQLGTYAPILGQEAIQAGIGSAMKSDDVFVMSYREQGAQLMRGVKMSDLFLYWSGDERGSD